MARDVCRDHVCRDQELSWHITPTPTHSFLSNISQHPQNAASIYRFTHEHTQQNAVKGNKALEICVSFVKVMAVNSNEQKSQDSLKFVESPDEGTTGPQCESHLDLVNLSNLNFVKTPSMDAQPNGRSHANLKNGGTDVYGSYILDMDIEKGKSEAPKVTEETGGNVKTDDCITRMLQREIASLVGGKYTQLLMNHSFELPKFACKDKCLTEKVYDTPSNRLRKYKRSASFNSRRVVLLFSLLSSMGTIILIYLTLRVRMSIDGAGNV